MIKASLMFLALLLVAPVVTSAVYGQYRDPFAQKNKSKEPKKKKVKNKIVKEKRLKKNDDPFVSKATGKPYNKKYNKAQKKKKSEAPGPKRKLFNRNKKSIKLQNSPLINRKIVQKHPSKHFVLNYNKNYFI